MEASAWPDLWDIALSEREPSDARATLLELHADQFVNAPVRDRETIESFEAIALGFLPLVRHPVLLAVARTIAPCEDLPASVIAFLAERSPETRAIVSAAAARLPSSVIDLLLGSSHDRAALAARADLDDGTLGRLLILAEPPIEDALACNGALDPTSEAFAQLVDRGRRRPALARLLLARGDLTLADEAALSLAADPERRADICERLAASAAFQRTHLVPRLVETARDELLLAAADGDVGRVETLLGDALGLPPSAEWRILEDERYELLALGLNAAGMEEEDAVRVFLTLHPAISHSVGVVFALVRSLRAVPRATALALVELILGERTASERGGRHMPAMDPSGTPSQAAPGLPQRRPSAEDRQRRLA
jgi:hypothetical protein